MVLSRGSDLSIPREACSKEINYRMFHVYLLARIWIIMVKMLSANYNFSPAILVLSKSWLPRGQSSFRPIHREAHSLIPFQTKFLPKCVLSTCYYCYFAVNVILDRIFTADLVPSSCLFSVNVLSYCFHM